MLTLCLVLFWTAIGVILYTYGIFPLLVIAHGIAWRRAVQLDDVTPQVSLIIVAHNEAAGIGAKLENILALDYPRERLEVIVASDGSDDGTDDIVRRHQVKLLSLPRQGKIPALNAAVAASSGDVLAFSDANSMYAPEALRTLVQPLADPQVGGVAGNQVYVKQNDVANDGEHMYWNFDRMLKQYESAAGSTISATGAIYAIRRSLFQTVPSGVTDDFYISTGVILKGYRLVFAPEAVALEPAAAAGGAEFSRKVRLMTRGLRGVFLRYKLLNPLTYGFYSLALFSHKILRRLVAFPLLLVFLLNPLLWQEGAVYQIAFLIQAAFYLCALAGMLAVRTRLAPWKLLTVPFYFVMANVAAMIATFNVLLGRRIDLWQPHRSTGDRPSRVRITT